MTLYDDAFAADLDVGCSTTFKLKTIASPAGGTPALAIVRVYGLPAAAMGYPAIPRPIQFLAVELAGSPPADCTGKRVVPPVLAMH